MTEATDSKEALLGDLRTVADDDLKPAVPPRVPDSPASLHPADLSESAPLLCVRSLSDSPDNLEERPNSSEIRAFTHQHTGQAGWIVDATADSESRRNSKRFHTSAVDDLDVEGFGSDDLLEDQDSMAEEQVEEYKVTVTAPEKEAEEPPSPKGPKLPLTMAKLETLNCSSGSSSPSELPQLVRSQSVQSLTSNLYALAEELSARKAEVNLNPCRVCSDEDLTRDTSAEFASLVKSVLSMNLERVQELIDTGVSVNMALREEDRGTVHFSTLLHTVCDLPPDPDEDTRNRCVRIIQTLISAKANINPRNSKGSTPLMCACRQKNIEVVKLLISHSARVHPCDERGHSCLNWAAALREEADPLQSNSPRKARPDDEERSSYLVELLLVATVQEQRERARREKTAERAHPTKRRTSMAIGEAKDSSVEEQLVAYSEALKIIEPKSFPPLRMAVMQENVSAALVMMACGAAPIWLHDAVRVGSLDLVRALLHFDADPAKQDTSGASSIDTAVQLGSPMEIVEILRQNVHKNRRVSESNVPRRISVASAISIRSLMRQPRSPSSRSLSFMRSASPKNRSGEDLSDDSQESQCHAIFQKISAKCRRFFEANSFQCVTFIVLFMALYLPDIYVITDSDYMSLDVLLTLIFLFFTTDCIVQVVGFGKTYLRSFFFIMDIVGTLSLIVEFSSFKSQMQANNLTQNSVVMRATRAAKIGARAGRLTRLVKLMRFLPFLRKRKQLAEESTAKVISSRLVSRVSSVVACLIIFSVQVLPLPETLSMSAQDFSIQMWTEHLRRSLEDGDDPVVVNELVSEYRAFYDARTSYQPYSFLNGTQVLWQRRAPALQDRSMRIQYGNAVVLFDFSHQVHLEAGMNMIVITLTIFLMVTFSLLISRAVSKHALTPLEILLLKVRKIGRLIWLQVESLQAHFSNGNAKAADNEFGNEDETVLLRDVLSKIGVLSAIRLMRPDEDAQALAFLGTGAVLLDKPKSDDGVQENVHREALAVRLQTVITFDLENLEVENITTWRFNPIDFEDPSTAPFVCAKLLTTCVPLQLKHAGVTDIEISAFAEIVHAGYSKVPYHNFNHAVDTMHSVYVILQECRPLFSALETYMLLMCAAAHDIGHPGFSNEFLVQTQHELALRYNDSAPLENMHTARLFEILSDPSTNIIGQLEEATRKDIRKMSIEAILHTDNSCHFNEVKALQMIHEVHDEDFRQTCARFIPGDDENKWPDEEIIDIFKDKDTHDTIRNVLLHFADISNSMKPFSIARVWADLVLEEFFLQGDKLKELGLPVPPMNDREKTQRPTSQIGFIEFIVSPLVFTIVKIIPPLAFSEQAMMGTVKYWFEEWASSASPSKSEYTQMVNRVKGLYEKANFAKQTGTLFKRWKSI